MTEEHKYQLILSSANAEELKDNITLIANRDGNIMGSSRPWNAIKQAGYVDNVIKRFQPDNILTRSYGIRHMAVYLRNNQIVLEAKKRETKSSGKETKLLSQYDALRAQMAAQIAAGAMGGTTTHLQGKTLSGYARIGLETADHILELIDKGKDNGNNV